jgi:hypothetical protein
MALQGLARNAAVPASRCQTTEFCESTTGGVYTSATVHCLMRFERRIVYVLYPAPCGLPHMLICCQPAAHRQRTPARARQVWPELQHCIRVSGVTIANGGAVIFTRPVYFIRDSPHKTNMGGGEGVKMASARAVRPRRLTTTSSCARTGFSSSTSSRTRRRRRGGDGAVPKYATPRLTSLDALALGVSK